MPKGFAFAMYAVMRIADFALAIDDAWPN